MSDVVVKLTVVAVAIRKAVNLLLGERLGRAQQSAGVEECGRVARKVATKVAGGEITDNEQDQARITIGPDQVREYLDKPKFHFEAALRTERAGVATGLAVTPVGGDVLFIEAACMPGKDRLTLTGQLVEVMK